MFCTVFFIYILQISSKKTRRELLGRSSRLLRRTGCSALRAAPRLGELLESSFAQGAGEHRDRLDDELRMVQRGGHDDVRRSSNDDAARDDDVRDGLPKALGGLRILKLARDTLLEPLLSPASGHVNGMLVADEPPIGLPRLVFGHRLRALTEDLLELFQKIEHASLRCGSA